VIVRALMENAAHELEPAYSVMSQATQELLDQYSDDHLATILDFLRRATAITAGVISQTRAETAATDRIPPRIATDRAAAAT
jgi:hypothetical protein